MQGLRYFYAAMRILNTELRLRVKNRKPRPFSRAASADAAVGDNHCCANPAFDDTDGAGVSFNRGRGAYMRECHMS